MTPFYFYVLQVVHTQAKVIADEDVMYKYISKNLLFVATVSPKASGEIGSVTPEESWLIVYLVDTITGRILHRMTHHASQGPVHAVSISFHIQAPYFHERSFYCGMIFIFVFSPHEGIK